MEKPWLPPTDTNITEFNSRYFAVHNRKIALVLFLCIVGVLFFLLFSAYHMRIVLSTDWVASPEPPLIWANSLVLALVSAVMEWSRSTVQRGEIDVARTKFIIAGLLTLVFLIGQMIIWKQLSDLGYTLPSNPANAFFYLITGIHGIHLFGGLIAWLRTILRMRVSVQDDLSEIRMSIDLCTLYWHFLLLVWIVMLALFIST